MKQETSLTLRKEPWLKSRPAVQNRIHVVIADDHPIVLAGLESLFALEKDIKVVARCGTGEETLAAVRKHRPDILLLDIRMPGKNTFDVIRELRDEHLPTRVVLLTAAINDDEALEAVRLGVGGVVLKGMPPKLLIQCIRKVYAGERWMERGFLSHAVERLVQREAGARELAKLLTPREIELVRMVASGLRNKEIGKKLFISEGTVKIHLHHIFEKLNVNSRHALTLYARNNGLV